MAKKKEKLDIKISKKEQGSFTKWAKSKGKSPCEAAKMVMANPDNFTKRIVKKASAMHKQQAAKIDRLIKSIKPKK